MFNLSHSKLEALIGPNTEIEGDIRTNASIRIDGKIKGGIFAESVVIGESGTVLGDVSANRVTIGGKVKGNISSSMMLELLSSGQIIGDIKTSKLTIADGACFEGNCQMIKSDGKVIDLESDTINDNGNGKTNLKVVGGKRS
jgi:cytoskeletal protein CcmA (bactofilin family)